MSSRIPIINGSASERVNFNGHNVTILKKGLEANLGLFDLGLRVGKCSFCFQEKVIQLPARPVCHGKKMKLTLRLAKPLILSWKEKTGLSFNEVIGRKLIKIRQQNWPKEEFVTLSYDDNGVPDKMADVNDLSGRFKKVPILLLARLVNWVEFQEAN